ncbi:activator-dependent family glycosyltransferase [Amycolatopsis suaedae]|uniref:Activator-dependent family glycosyltransferase n=1 Tax=Amycolatopsis suaedae TaxID=2510978 RepID=A0A4Q7J2M9_9PSEU|nr:activator-dependent family glycosyltransferase [Amycolatopsis suaedae]RZQ61167.1 activator-dependent family glycosyltransferase [Amycolatopsis suaedae]
MRILFTANPEPTAFVSMVPLAWALRTAGHEVRFASQPGFAGRITQAGLTAVGVGRDVDMYRRIQAVMSALEHNEKLREAYGDLSDEEALALLDLKPGLPAPFDVVEYPERATWDHMLGSYAGTVEGDHKPENFPVIAGLVEFARAWEPDLVVWEPSSYAGAIAAKACGAAHARLLGRLDLLGVTRGHFTRLLAEQPADQAYDPFAAWVDGYCRKYGFEFSEDMVTGHFTVDQLPGSLTMHDPGLHYVPMRFVPYGGAATVEKWLTRPAERPRVALTLGTTAAERFEGYTVDVGDILTALGDLDVEVVATIADNVRDTLPELPANARVVSYAPLHALAPTCSVVINHAGAGTFLSTALYGVPQLTLPWDLDEPELARRATTQGGALTIHGDACTGTGVRENVLRLLDEPRFAERAGVLRDEMLAMPAPNDVVGTLEELTTKFRIR